MTIQDQGAAAHWYVSRSGAQLGPFDTREIEHYFVSGQLTASDAVWRSGWANWARAGDVFKHLIAPPPPPPAAPPPDAAPAPAAQKAAKLADMPPQAKETAAGHTSARTLPEEDDVEVEVTVETKSQSKTEHASRRAAAGKENPTARVGARIITIHRFTGVVVGSERRSQTRVSGGYNNQPVTTSTTHTNEIFLRLPDGAERTLDVEPAGIRIRVGNTVTVLLGTLGDQTDGWYGTVYNHDTRQLGHLPKGIAKLAGPPLFVTVLVLLGLASLACIPLAADRYGNPLPLILGCIAFAVWGLIGMSKRRALREAFEESLKDVRG